MLATHLPYYDTTHHHRHHHSAYITPTTSPAHTQLLTELYLSLAYSGRYLFSSYTDTASAYAGSTKGVRMDQSQALTARHLHFESIALQERAVHTALYWASKQHHSIASSSTIHLLNFCSASTVHILSDCLTILTKNRQWDIPEATQH